MVLRYSAAKGRYYDSVDIEQATAPKRWRALLRRVLGLFVLRRSLLVYERSESPV